MFMLLERKESRCIVHGTLFINCIIVQVSLKVNSVIMPSDFQKAFKNVKHPVLLRIILINILPNIVDKKNRNTTLFTCSLFEC